MFVIISSNDLYATYGETLDQAISKWRDDTDSLPDITNCIIIQGKRKKAEIVLTDYPEPKKPAKPAAK